MECEFCKNIFTNKQNLKTHQRSAKYCLKIQGKKPDKIFSCNICKNEFSSKIVLQRHIGTHNEDEVEMFKRNIFLESEIENIKNQNLYQQDTIHELKKQNESLQKSLERVAISRDFQEEATIDLEIEDEGKEDEEYGCVAQYQLTPLDIGKGFVIEHREEDGYINVTNLCKAGGKQFKHWKSLKRTKAFLKALSNEVGNPTSLLIKYQTGYGSAQATWVHPQVAINIAQWISPIFDVKVSAWTYEVMMTGKVDITATKSYQQLHAENKTKDIKIQYMTKKYVKAQPRVQYEERNVVYILTTSNMKKERRYILGKATNLTNRLSTYNKSDEHEVIYYQECPDEDSMGIVETLVFSKLKEYREQANRERFVLPEEKDIKYFIDTIRKCVEFV
jgi:hypothetical protein